METKGQEETEGGGGEIGCEAGLKLRPGPDPGVMSMQGIGAPRGLSTDQLLENCLFF